MNEEMIKLIDTSVSKLKNLSINYGCDRQSVGEVIGTLNMLKVLLNNYDSKVVLQVKGD